jgi:hypothetical protein
MMGGDDIEFKPKIDVFRLSDYIKTNWVTFEIQVLGLREL